MRCKNCGLENDDNLYICQNCGSPLYDEADVNDEDSTVEFKKIGGDNTPNNDNNQNNDENQNNDPNNNQNNDEDEKKKKLTTVIIVLSVVLVAVIAGVIGAVIANNNNKEEDLTSTSTSTTVESTVKETTTKPTTTESTTAPLIQHMVTVKSTEGGNVDGGGAFEKGKQIKITAKANDGYNFIGWYTPNGVRVSQSLSYTFTLTEDVTYEAKFEKIETTTMPTTTQALPDKPELTPQNEVVENG